MKEGSYWCRIFIDRYRYIFWDVDNKKWGVEDEWESEVLFKMWYWVRVMEGFYSSVGWEFKVVFVWLLG